MAQPGTINFFERQDEARGKTGRLAFLFAIAVAVIAVAIYISVRIILWLAYYRKMTEHAFAFWDPGMFVITCACVILFIAIVSSIKILLLRGDGSTVARMLGGRQVLPDTADLSEKRLCNVVEEISLASGVAVPQIFVMDSEQGINAFAAGATPNRAAVAVTSGTVAYLNRDELQGVIAHEFSHILNGDMRLNVRLIGVLAGIFGISAVGWWVVRGAGGKSSKGSWLIVLGGILLLVIGYIGTFVGRIIQSAICRQREFLADASAVQFTRNPAGIAGALKKIGGLAAGSRLRSPRADEAAHLFFGQGTKVGFLSSLLASHPPLAERIMRLDPSFDGQFPRADGIRPARDAAAAVSAGARSGVRAAVDVAANPTAVFASIGNPNEDNLKQGSMLLSLVSDSIKALIATPSGASAAIYALLLGADTSVKEIQLEVLGRFVRKEELEKIPKLADEIAALEPRCKLAIVELSFPALKRLSIDELDGLASRVDALARADEKFTLFEFVLQWMIANRLKDSGRRSGQVVYTNIKPLLGDAAVMLAAIAKAGNPADALQALCAYDGCAARIPGLARMTERSFASETSFDGVGRALNRMALASFAIKGTVAEACANCALADRKVTAEEAELLRVFFMALDIPLPQFALPVD